MTTVFSTSITEASLAHHVGMVVLGRPKEQMLRVAARRIVAVVANKARVVAGYWAVRQFKGNAMRVSGASVQPELAVSVGADVANPQPAAIRLLHAWPKARSGIGAFVIVAAFLGAVLADLRDAVSHQHAAARAWFRHAPRPDSNSTIAVTAVRAKAAGLAGTPHEFHAACDACAFDLGRVVLPETYMALLVSLQSERHIYV